MDRIAKAITDRIARESRRNAAFDSGKAAIGEGGAVDVTPGGGSTRKRLPSYGLTLERAPKDGDDRLIMRVAGGVVDIGPSPFQDGTETTVVY